MSMSREVLEFVCAGMSAVAFILILVRRRVHAAERRVGMLLVSILLVSLACIAYCTSRYGTPLDLLVALLLIELGVFAQIYDSHRTFRGVSGALRNVGNLYIFAGVACLLSRFTRFPVALWILPLVLFSLGYFALRSRRGAANFCKGLGAIISIAFIASILYDVKEGPAHGPRAGRLGGRLLPDIMKPSMAEELNTLNARLATADADKRRLAAELTRLRREHEEMQRDAAARLSKLEKMNTDALGALETSRAATQKLQDALGAENAARVEAERKLAEARAAGKESFTTIEEKLKLAAENLKKVVAEKEALKAELESMKLAVPGAPPGSQAGAADMQALERRLKDKEEELAGVLADRARLKSVLERIGEALQRGAEATPAQGGEK